MKRFNCIEVVFVSIFLASCGGGGSPDSAITPPTISMNLSSNLNEIYIHNKIILSWSSSNADSCLASGNSSDWSGTKINNGSQEIIIRDAKESTFTLTCSSASSSVNALSYCSIVDGHDS